MNILKRALDVILSFLGIGLSSPLWLLIIILILLEDGRPVFFQQERIGLKGQIFKTLKFRTMKHVAGQGHLDMDLQDDPRITKLGKILRASAMDELPQLLNILKGEMSFVGPRALPFLIDDEEKSKYYKLDQVPGYERRIKVRPGLTGLSQIYAPKTASREEKFQYDIKYIKGMGFWSDLRLIFLSFWITLRGAWEKRVNKL